MTKGKLARKNEPRPAAINDHPDNRSGALRCIGGSQSDKWNRLLADQAVEALWTKNSDLETYQRQLGATCAALVGIGPKDELEGMMAAQLIAAHNAAMECYRRAMHREQSFEARRENLSLANKLSRTWSTLLEALNRHRGKGQQKVTVEHVHVHAGGQAVVGMVETAGSGGPGGGAPAESEESTPCKADCRCTRAHAAEQGRGAGGRASRPRWRTVDVGCTAERRQARRSLTPMPRNTASIRPRRSRGVGNSQRACV